ncbi:MAG TPA: HEAT repeat domain-containing protein [Terracidiphilus sp.]|jgi:HEAT repeat protein|nr:HEAT repeat domain-containing protein [Terracidiphilus sp.]
MSASTSSSQPLPHLVLGITLCLVLGCPLLPRLAHGQATQKTPTELDDAIASVSSGDVSPRAVVVIADAGAVQAIPALEEQFRRVTDVDTKVSIASGLVKLRDRDNTYWNFLLEQATLAVDSNVPDANFSELQGKMMDPAPELQVWADAHNVSVNTAFQYARYDIPGKVLQLATTGDPRGIPLLRRALQSHNYLIVAWAAKGLAQIQDKQSIPLIVAAAQRAPTGYNYVIAESLLYFDDTQAQSAADQLMPKEKATMLREARAQGMGVFGW